MISPVTEEESEREGTCSRHIPYVWQDPHQMLRGWMANPGVPGPGHHPFPRQGLCGTWSSWPVLGLPPEQTKALLKWPVSWL